MEYLIGAVAGAFFVCVGFFVGYRMRRADRSTPPASSMTEQDKRLIAEMEDRQRQWDNMCSYTGKPQVTAHED